MTSDEVGPRPKLMAKPRPLCVTLPKVHSLLPTTDNVAGNANKQKEVSSNALC